MSALREAVVLPVMLLTVVLAASLRPGATLTVVPPSLGSLVAAIAILGLLVRSGTLAPERLMHASRPALHNMTGLCVLVTLLAGSAQLVTMLMPESGVPALLMWTVLVALLAQAYAMTPDRTRMLRGLLVTLGATFTLKFVILATLSAPAESRLARALQMLFEGVTLGGVTQRELHAAEGYLAFVAIMLYLVAVALLPSASWQMVRTTSNDPLPHYLPMSG